jgi:hypothetical protein
VEQPATTGESEAGYGNGVTPIICADQECAEQQWAGIAGTSYDGWTAVMAALGPHPALKAAIEQASSADQFLGFPS